MHTPSVWKTTLSTILLLGVWPCFGLFKYFIFTELYPYPYFISMVSFLFLFCGCTFFFIGISLKTPNFSKTLCRKIFRIKNFLNWGAVAGLVLVLFIMAETYSREICAKNRNICRILFRGDIFLSVLFFLSILKSEDSGSPLDWVFGLFLAVGISIVGWKIDEPFSMTGMDYLVLTICGLVAVLAFGFYPIILRKATKNSKINQILYAQSLVSFVGTLVLTISFDGSLPWIPGVESSSLSWKVMITCVFMAVWSWSVVFALAYSDAVVPAMALQISLFLGDFGLLSFNWQEQILIIFGFPLVGVGVLWLIKRIVTLHCPNCHKKPCWVTNDDDEESEELMPLVPKNSKEQTTTIKQIPPSISRKSENPIWK